MFSKSLFTLLTLAGLLVSGTASADNFHADTVVEDDVDIFVDAYDIDTKAYDYSYAETTIGTIDDGALVEDYVDIEVWADDVYTKAENRSTSCTAIGSVGACQDQEFLFKN